MSKFDFFLDCLVRDFFAVVLSVLCIFLPMGLWELLFDIEKSSFFLYVFSCLITAFVGAWSSVLVVKLLIKKLPIGHYIAVSLIISLATLFGSLILPAIEMDGLWEHLTFIFGSPYGWVNGANLGIVLVGICYLGSSLLGVAAMFMK